MKPEEKEILEKLQTARQLYQEQKFPRAIELFEQLAGFIRDDEENLPIIQIELAWSYYYNQSYQKAIDNLQQALKSAKLTPQQEFDCYRIIGFSYEILGQLKQAKSALEKALSMEISDREKRFAFFELGKVLFNSGNVIEAENPLKIADTLFGEDELSYRTAVAYYLGFCKYFQKQPEKAQEYFDFIIQNSSDHKTSASGYFGLAHLHFLSGDFPVLVDLCEKILRMDPQFFDKETLGYFLATAYQKLKKWEELEAVLDELEKNYPDGRYVTAYPQLRESLQRRTDNSDQ